MKDAIERAKNRRSGMTVVSTAGDVYSLQIRIVAAEKSLDLEVLEVESLKDVQSAHIDHLPALMDRDLTLDHPQTILEYMDERWPSPQLMPGDPLLKAVHRQFLHRIEEDLVCLLERMGRGDQESHKVLIDRLVAMSPLFTHAEFFMSSEMSLVDCVLAPLLWKLRQEGVALPPQMRRYTANLMGRESVRRILGDV